MWTVLNQPQPILDFQRFYGRIKPTPNGRIKPTPTMYGPIYKNPISHNFYRIKDSQ